MVQRLCGNSPFVLDTNWKALGCTTILFLCAQSSLFAVFWLVQSVHKFLPVFVERAAFD
jgi:hypothetical protein